MQKSLNAVRRSVIGGTLFVPFIPLIISSSMFFPFITGKNFVFRILIEILFGLWAILAVFDKQYRPRKSWISVLLYSFMGFFVLSTIFGVNPYRSFWSNYERMEGLVGYLHLFAYFFIVANVFKTKKVWDWFLHINLGANLIIVFHSLFQLSGKAEIHQGGVRLDSTFGNASYLAIYMVFNIFLALMYFFRFKDWRRWLYVPLMVLQTIILYYTATRGAILGFVGGLLLMAILVSIFSENKKIKKASGVGLIIIFLLAAIFVAVKNTSYVQNSPVLSRFANISFNEPTTQSRLVIWKLSWKGFLERPLLGWGAENYNLVFNKYYEPILWKQETWFDRAHNVFLDRLIANGIFGFLSYLGLFGAFVYYLWFKREKLGFSVYDSAVLTAMFAAYFFHNLFVFDNLTSSVLFFGFLAYVHNFATQKPENGSYVDATKDIESNPGQKAAYSVIIGFATVFVVYIVNVPGILAARELIKSFSLWNGGDIQNAFNGFQRTINYDSFGTTETREHFTRMASTIVSRQDIAPDLRQKISGYAVSEMKKQISEMSGDIREMIFLGSFYNKAGRYDEAIDILSRAIEISPKKQVLYFELSSSYLNKKEYEKAFELLKKTFELDQEQLEARKNYAVASLFLGKEDLAEDLMKDYGGLIIPDQGLISAFAKIGRYDKVAAIWEKIVAQSPNNAQYKVNLAATYLQLGKRKESIALLKEAIELEPKFKDQGEYYIKEIEAGRNP